MLSVLCRDPSTRLMDGQNKMWTGTYLCGRVWTGKKNLYIYIYYIYFLILCISLQYVGLLRALYRALYTSCYCHIIYVYFMSVNATFAVAARTRKVSRRPSTCPTTGNILILHKPLVTRQSEMTDHRTSKVISYNTFFQKLLHTIDVPAYFDGILCPIL